MDNSIVFSELNSITAVLAAVAALGTSAFGLVDVTKVFGGGVSNAGLGYIKAALAPFAPALLAAGGDAWFQTLRAHWLNGTPKDDQKAIAKSLIRLGLSKANAASLAVFGRVDGKALEAVVEKLDDGQPLNDVDLNVIGRFDATVDAALDGAFERADQYYRNASKALAAVAAIVLAITGEWIIVSSGGKSLDLQQFLLAVLIGVVSVPLAPMAKDISSSLESAVKAMKSVGG